MKKSFYFILIILSIYSFNKTYSQKALTLNDAITIALNQNTNVIKNTNSISTFQAGVKSAYGNLLPNLSLNGRFNWQRISDNGGNTQLDYFGNPITIAPSEVDSRNWSVSAGGSVTLFDGLSNIASINQSKANLESAKLTLEKLKQDVTLQTVTYYMQIISNQELLKFQEENLKYNQGLLDQIKQKYDLKMIPISDLYSQQAQTANSNVAYLQAKNNLEIAKVNLLTFLSMELSEKYQFDSTATTIQDSELIDASLENLYKYALSNRKDYQSLIYQKDGAQNQLTIARSGFFPNLSANYGFSSSAIQPSDLLNRKIYSLGLALNIPIFSNWSTATAIQIADVQIQNNYEDLKALEQNIKSQVTIANLNLQTAKQQLEASNVALTASKESWIIETETYKLGAATFLDLQLSYNNYLQAQYNMINNEYNYLTTQYTLLNAVGRY